MSRRVSKGYKSLYDVEQEELRKENYKKYMGNIHRGDIFYFDKSPVTGVEQQGGRPGVIVSNDACNNTSEFLLVCYLTTQSKANLPTHVPVVCMQKSTCLCEQIHTLSKEKMQTFYGSVTPEELEAIDKALVTTLGIDVNSINPEEYDKFAKDLNKANEALEGLRKELEDRNTEMQKYIKYGSELEAEIEKLQRQIVPVENTPEYIRMCAERDVYMKLYNDLLEKISK